MPRGCRGDAAGMSGDAAGMSGDAEGVAGNIKLLVKWYGMDKPWRPSLGRAGSYEQHQNNYCALMRARE